MSHIDWTETVNYVLGMIFISFVLRRKGFSSVEIAILIIGIILLIGHARGLFK